MKIDENCLKRHLHLSSTYTLSFIVWWRLKCGNPTKKEGDETFFEFLTSRLHSYTPTCIIGYHVHLCQTSPCKIWYISIKYDRRGYVWSWANWGFLRFCTEKMVFSSGRRAYSSGQAQCNQISPSSEKCLLVTTFKRICTILLHMGRQAKSSLSSNSTDLLHFTL